MVIMAAFITSIYSITCPRDFINPTKQWAFLTIESSLAFSSKQRNKPPYLNDHAKFSNSASFILNLWQTY